MLKLLYFFKVNLPGGISLDLAVECNSSFSSFVSVKLVAPSIVGTIMGAVGDDVTSGSPRRTVSSSPFRILKWTMLFSNRFVGVTSVNSCMFVFLLFDHVRTIFNSDGSSVCKKLLSLFTRSLLTRNSKFVNPTLICYSNILSIQYVFHNIYIYILFFIKKITILIITNKT